jgi:hypothetical protein
MVNKTGTAEADQLEGLQDSRLAGRGREVGRSRRDAKGRGGIQGAGNEGDGDTAMTAAQAKSPATISSADGLIKWRFQPEKGPASGT